MDYEYQWFTGYQENEKTQVERTNKLPAVTTSMSTIYFTSKYLTQDNLAKDPKQVSKTSNGSILKLKSLFILSLFTLLPALVFCNNCDGNEFSYLIYFFNIPFKIIEDISFNYWTNIY